MLSPPIVGTVSTAIWLPVFCSCALSFSVELRRASPRPGSRRCRRRGRSGTEHRPRAQTREQREEREREGQQTRTHGIAAAPLIARLASSIGRLERSSPPRRIPREAVSASIASIRSSARENASAGRPAAQRRRHRVDHRSAIRGVDAPVEADVGDDLDVPFEQAREHEHAVARAGAEKLPLEEHRLRELPHFTCGANAVRANSRAYSRHRDGEQARSPRPPRASGATLNQVAYSPAQSGRTRSSATTTSAASATPSAKAFHDDLGIAVAPADRRP